MNPLIICAAVTGGAPARSKSPHHPVTPHEVAQAAVACWRAGAAMVHLHARREDGSTTMDLADYRETVDRITATGCDAIINLSAGDNGGRADHTQRLSIAESGADMVSLDAGSFNIGERLYDNRPSYLREMATRMKALGIRPEVELFDLGHFHFLQTLVSEGLLSAPAYIQFVFGAPGALPPDVRLLPLLLEHLPSGAQWAVSAQTGDHQKHLALEMCAFTQDGHVRTGMEDYVHVRPGELAKTNADMVEQWVATAQIWGRPVASPETARQMLGIKHVQHSTV